MRIAVLSEVHGNLEALDAVLADGVDVTAYWFLGDLVVREAQLGGPGGATRRSRRRNSEVPEAQLDDCG